MPFLLDQFGKPMIRDRRRPHWRRLLAKYDAAQTTDDNIRHWPNADSLSADAANSPEVRRKLRNRARYEAANNSYCRGMVDTLSNDVIGTGPRIQVLTGNKEADARIEREFSRWAKAVKLAKKLRTMRKAKCVDGEAFGLLVTNNRLRTRVTLDLRLVEADQVTTPDLSVLDGNAVDGVRFDQDGNPVEYHVLRHHPGDTAVPGWATDYDTWDAKDVIHLFREDRPGQHRGIPEITPALPLFSQLRRYTLAVLAAAETAADFAAVIQTKNPPDAGYEPAGTTSTYAAPEPMDVFELAQRLVTVLPDGYELGQIRAEQPSTTYGEFKREILAEAFAAIVMPYNVGAHDSSEFNYASGKLDRLTYSRAIRIEQSDWEIDCLQRVFWAWYDEAALIPGYLPEGLPPAAEWIVTWYWDGLEDIDPEKAAKSAQVRLRSGQTSYPALYAPAGLDHETEMSKQAAALGMSLEEYRRRLADSLLGPTGSTESRSQSDAVTETA